MVCLIVTSWIVTRWVQICLEQKVENKLYLSNIETNVRLPLIQEEKRLSFVESDTVLEN